MAKLSPEDALDILKSGNAAYITARTNPGDVSAALRRDLTVNGQHPVAAVVTCADSRAAPEHIFAVGLGQIFTVRTAGNVVADFERGSLEYAVEHLHVPLIVVMGHTHCGAVGGALQRIPGDTPSSLRTILTEIQASFDDDTPEDMAIRMNVDNSVHRVLESEYLRMIIGEYRLKVVRAIYNIESGEVNFW
jgi:carbonic anhydrase